MFHLLKQMGKEAVVVNQDAVPLRYQFLDEKRDIRKELPDGFSADTMVILDCSNPERLGDIKGLITPDITVVTIDHHQALPQPGDPAYLDPDASSTGELLVDLIQAMEMPISQPQAEQLYVAIVSDTGGFRFPNTTARSLAAAAEMVRYGARPDSVAAKIYEQRSAASLRLLSRALGKIDILEEGKVALVCLKQADFAECQAGQNEAEGIVDFLVTMRDAQVGVLIREGTDHIHKVNLRTRGTVKANRIAETMGGGGHPNAAGYRTRHSLGEAKDQVLEEIRRNL
jgi:phosphoesterase RecJ-like protein